MALKVLIVEEVPALRQHARVMLQRALGDGVLEEVIETDSGADALNLFDQHRPEFLILDIATPGTSGLRIAQYIWSKAPATKILFWVNQQREFHIKELKRVIPPGAIDGYVLKSADDEKLCRAIESMIKFNNPYTDPNLRSGTASLGAAETHLTEAEQETLGDLLLGLTDKAIARKRNLTVRGVQNRLASLATKLLGRDRTQNESGIEFYNLRVRMIFEALKRGVYTVEDIPELEKNLYCWMATTSPSAQLFS